MTAVLRPYQAKVVDEFWRAVGAGSAGSSWLRRPRRAKP